MIVEDAAKKLPPRSEKTEEVADGSFEKQKQNAEQTFQFIKEKIPAVKQNIDSENPDEIAELQPLISELSEKLKTFANQAKAQRELEGLAPADKEAIDKALALIYEKSANLMNRIANLLVSQVKYTSSLKIERALEAIQLQMNAISKLNPLHLCDLIPKMKSSLSEIKKHFKKDPEIATELSTMIEELSSSKKDAPAAFERIEREEQILMSLKDLYPCFVDPAKKTDLRSDDSAQEESDPGLLVQLATYEQCKHNRTERNRLFPEGFDLKDTKIKEALALLPAEDQPALKQFIKRIKDYGKNPVGIDFQREIWVPLTEKLQQIYAAANERNNAANRDVDKTLHHFNPRIVQKIAQYQNLRKDKQRELSQTAAQAEELIAQLQKAAADAQRAPAVKINPEHLPYIAGTLAGLTGLVLGPVPALALGAAANLAVNNLGALANDNGRMGAAVNVAGGAALAGVAANLLPGLAGIAGGAKLAYNAAQNMEEEAIKTTVKEVVDEVMKIFESFYGFIIGPHCSRALATWGMQGVLDTKPSEPVSVFDQSLASNAASAVANLAV